MYISIYIYMYMYMYTYVYVYVYVYIFPLIARNRDFDGKIPYNSFSKWLSKCSHPLFCISC